MTPIGWTYLIIGIIAGAMFGAIFFKKFPNLLNNSKEREMRKIVKNPHLLVEKLKSHGKFYSEGKELDIKVGIDNETKKEIVIVEERETKKSKQIQEKTSNKKIQSKAKKKGVLKKSKK